MLDLDLFNAEINASVYFANLQNTKRKPCKILKFAGSLREN
jgi:hypothetical protein